MSHKKSEVARKMKGNIFSPADTSLKRQNRSIIKHAKKTGKRVCTTCGSGISHQEKGEDTCNSCS